VTRGGLRAAWDAFRYARLLPRTAQSRRSGRAYAHLVGTVEAALDPVRGRVAQRRLQRWLGVSSAAARRTFRRSLVSEAQEEADTVFFMAHESDLRPAFRVVGRPPVIEGPTIYVSLHFGSPLLLYLHLALARVPDCRVIARPLDVRNPMCAAKRAYATRKVAWAERVSGHPFLLAERASMFDARAQLRRGGSLYMLVDVPGDVVDRSATFPLFGERVVLANGLATLARIATPHIQPLLTIPRAGGFDVHYGSLVSHASDASVVADALAALVPMVAAAPQEWWFWPYVPPRLDAEASPGGGT